MRSLALLENKPLLLHVPSDKADDLEGLQLAQEAKTLGPLIKPGKLSLQS